MPTSQRLLQAAERLFAARGIEAVSLRAVMSEAETNVAAVHYYFGSKQGLVEAVVAARVDEILGRRDMLIASLPMPADAVEVARTLVLPLIELVDRDGSDWVAVVAELLRTNHPALSLLSTGFGKRGSRIVELVEGLDDSADLRDVVFRLVQAMNAALLTLGNMTNTQRVLSRDDLSWTETEIRERLIGTVAAVLKGI